jgi:hypothetical protein
VVIEPPFCRPPVTPLSVPVTEPRPVLAEGRDGAGAWGLEIDWAGIRGLW